VTIHSSDPFATPDEAKSPVRRLRGRLPAPVTLWTGYARDGRPVGLTLSSTLVVDGAPGRLLGVVDEESALWQALGPAGRFAAMPLREADGRLADIFGGVMPAAGSAFAGQRWHDTDFGPVLDGVGAWAGCHIDHARPLGFGLLVEATIDQVEIGEEDPPPLLHYRGRYVAGIRARPRPV
jgi:3-hydroxy-9,10-secoandrosta-1,3,5(10)-triene-9,17-dione monooxygenase reductase component